MVKNNNKKIEDLDFLDGIPLAVALPEDSTLPDPERLMYYDGLKNRTLYLENEIDREYLIDFSKMIIAFNREDDEKGIPVEKRKPIKILIFLFNARRLSIFVRSLFSSFAKNVMLPVLLTEELPFMLKEPLETRP